MGETRNILLADDEPNFLDSTADIFKDQGYACERVENGIDAIAALSRTSFDLLVADIHMPGNPKMEFFQQAQQIRPGMPIIIVTGYPSLSTALQSVRLSIADYLIKPFEVSELLDTVSRALKPNRQKARTPDSHSIGGSGVGQRTDSNNDKSPNIGPILIDSASRVDYDFGDSFFDMIGKSRPMQQLFELTGRIAKTDANVMIYGESGTGKELLAKAIHQLSKRAKRPFVPVDTVALPANLLESELFGYEKGAFTGASSMRRGLLEYADRGSLFLDEITELALSLQSKLLRVIQEQEFRRIGSNYLTKVDLRIISATNREPKNAVETGHLRKDLFYRLSVIPITIPALRDRKEDIPLLVKHYVKKLGRVTGRANCTIEPDAIECLKSYSWPGNVRELMNVVEQMLSMSEETRLGLSSLPDSVIASTATTTTATTATTNLQLTYAQSKSKVFDEFDRSFFEQLMKKSGGNVSLAARLAGLNRKTVYRKMLRQKKEAKIKP